MMNSFFSRFRRKRRHSNISKVVQFNKNNTSSIKRKRPSKFSLKSIRKRSPIIIFFLVLVVFFIIFLSPLFRIENIEIIREDLSIDASEIEIFLAQKSIGKNIFTLSSSYLVKESEKDFPQWKDIQINKKLPRTIVASVKNFQAFASVDLELEQTITNPESGETKTQKEKVKYIVNEQGSVSYPKLGDTPHVHIIYNDVYDSEISIGTKLIPSKVINIIRSIQNIFLKDYDFAIKQVRYFKKGHEVHVDFFKFSLWIDLEQDIDMQIQKFSQALPHINIGEIEYIDLRIANRIIYKEQE